MSAQPWLQYRLESLEFRNGAKISFRHARMRYNDTEHAIMIEKLDSSAQDINDTLAEIAKPDGSLPDIKEIRYEMRFAGYRPFAFFYHPIGRGAGIRLAPQRAGQTVIIFKQEDGRPLFSKDYTVRQVTDGEIDDDRAVWQFHGWKHER